MRAKEFIGEGMDRSLPGRGDPDHRFSAAHPGLVEPKGRDDLYVGRYYDFYKIASLAGMDPKDLEKTDALTYLGNIPMFSAYTEVERDKLVRAFNKLGLKADDWIPRGSAEVADTHVKSPVTAFKGYKR